VAGQHFQLLMLQAVPPLLLLVPLLPLLVAELQARA
jgi:hypothetical protein